MSSEVPAVSWSGISLDYVVCNLSDPSMVKCLDDRVRDLQARVTSICRKRKWTIEWLKARDPETLDDEAKIVLEAHDLIEYLEYLRRGSA
ncbi:MAG: hypothetical protein GWN58_33905 [Anaerolineae bacterium]|nr:hypothetical protein [Anaerolineae bacterium]